MIDNRVAPRYAKSLLDLGIEQNRLDVLFDDMSALKSALENKDLFLLAKSPIIHADKKISIFNAIFQDSFDKISQSFLEIITRKGRETLLPDIAENFIKQYKDYNNVTPVKLTTATIIAEDALKGIQEALKSSSVTSDNVELETKVDADLIGGFVLEVDDKLYDASVAHKLKQVRKQFLDNK